MMRYIGSDITTKNMRVFYISVSREVKVLLRVKSLKGKCVTYISRRIVCMISKVRFLPSRLSSSEGIFL